MKRPAQKKPSQAAIKSAPRRQSPLNLRDIYTWHLRPPFDKRFDRERWWTKMSSDEHSTIEPVVALFELARRHPAVWINQIVPEELDADPRFGTLRCLHVIGLKSWPRLTAAQQQAWRLCAGKLKGVDSRPEHHKCFSIEEDVMAEISVERAFSDKCYRSMAVEKVDQLVAADMAAHPPTPTELGVKIKKSALLAFRQGYLLWAVAPDLSEDDAKSILIQFWRRGRDSRGMGEQRKRAENWLPIISKFEEGITKLERNEIFPSSAFTAYRRVLDGLPFESPRWLL